MPWSAGTGLAAFLVSLPASLLVHKCVCRAQGYRPQGLKRHLNHQLVKSWTKHSKSVSALGNLPYSRCPFSFSSSAPLPLRKGPVSLRDQRGAVYRGVNPTAELSSHQGLADLPSPAEGEAGRQIPAVKDHELSRGGNHQLGLGSPACLPHQASLSSSLKWRGGALGGVQRF